MIKNRVSNNKGVVLIISISVLTILLVLTTMFFSGILTERKAVDSQKFAMQSLNLAEAGAAHAIAELKERIRTDLKSRIEDTSQNWTTSTFQTYVNNNDSLGFLRNFAYATGDTQFTVASGQGQLMLNSPSLNTGVAGSYAATITVTANGAPTNPSLDVFIFPYSYSVSTQGTVTSISPSLRKTVNLSDGIFTITVRRDNFSKYALFTSHHSTPSGTTVWFTENTAFTGPVSTNDQFSFANNPSGHFTEEVTQHQNKARYYNDGNAKLIDSDHNGTKDVPVFDKGFARGQAIVNLPSSVTQNDLKTQALGTMSNPGSSGIYVPNSGGNVTGGIFVKGNASVTMSVDGSQNAVYTITQGGTTKTVTVDYTNNQTKVTEGATTTTYAGKPDGVGNEGVIIYTTDDITSFSGTVQKDSNVTVSSEKDIVITNNIKYQVYTSSPLSAKNPSTGADADNLLGILSWGGDVRIGTTAPNNVEIHGVVMAPHGVFEVDNYDDNAPRGTATVLGGAITDFYGPFGQFSGTTPTHGYGRNFVYDQRMLNGKTPPYFPYMSNFTSNDDNHIDDRLIWQDEGI